MSNPEWPFSAEHPEPLCLPDPSDDRVFTYKSRPAEPRLLTYLACPYSNDDPRVRRLRFHAANIAAGQLMNSGHVVFSPISHTHPIANDCGLRLDWEYWERFDRAYLSVSKCVVVLCIDGWRESVGVTAEIAIAREMGIPIAYVDADGIALPDQREVRP